MRKGILKYLDLIDKDIEKYEAKIETIKEKYPEDWYGMIWVEKAGKYQDELDQLKKLKDYMTGYAALTRENTKAKSDLSKCITVMSEAKRLLSMYGEKKMADQIERTIDNVTSNRICLYEVENDEKDDGN